MSAPWVPSLLLLCFLPKPARSELRTNALPKKYRQTAGILSVWLEANPAHKRLVYSFAADCILNLTMRLRPAILGHFEGSSVLVYARIFTGRGLSGVGLCRRGFDVRAGFHRRRES